MSHRNALLLLALAPALLLPLPAAHAALPVTITVNAASPIAPLKPIWRYFGYDEPNYTYTPNGLSLIKDLTDNSSTPAFFRTHSLLVTGDSQPALKWGSTNAYTEDSAGNPVYDWTTVDKIFDAFLHNGGKPLVQVGFMPQALSPKPEPYRHHWKPGDPYNEIYTGWTYPPKDYAKWSELIHQWALHCIATYGKTEVESWPWELWNEPNIGYFHGTVDDYCKMYDYTADALKRADPAIRIGGAEVAGGGSKGGMTFQRKFLEHCLTGKNAATGATGAPVDLISFHAKGAPASKNNHIVMGLSHQLHDIDGGFSVVASFPQLRNTPIIIGESDPDGCAACPAELDPRNGYRPGLLYASYTAEQIARTFQLADARQVNIAGAVTWAFEFENQPYFAGLRQLSTNGIPLPVLNTFRMLNKMDAPGAQRLATTSTGDLGFDALASAGTAGKSDVAALASRDPHRLCVFVWNYQDEELPGPPAQITLTLNALPPEAKSLALTRWQLDDTHANSFAAWQKMGSPQPPSPDQIDLLKKASDLLPLAPPTHLSSTDGAATVPLDLPSHALTLLEFSWP